MALGVPSVAVHGRWVKHTYPGSSPLPEREPPPDNRWQRGDIVDALYLADTDQTAWAEWYRHLAERMIPPLAQMPRELWTWQVDIEVADLSTPEHLAEVGLQPPAPGRSSWHAYPATDRGATSASDRSADIARSSARRPIAKSHRRRNYSVSLIARQLHLNRELLGLDRLDALDRPRLQQVVLAQG